MYNNFLKKVEAKIGPYRKWLIAFSGGLDSSVLLQVLVYLRKKIYGISLRAIHIHHGLSTYANHWVKHCQNICNFWNVPLIIKNITINFQKYGGMESAARIARYSAFTNLVKRNEIILTAHHLDDQCETFLLALKRGSGPAGLSSMSTHMYLNNKSLLIRPFLNIHRKNISIYSNSKEISWMEDKTNKDKSFDRNFLRLEVLPLLFTRWPYFYWTTARSANLCAEQEQLLEELLEEKINQLQDEARGLLIDDLKKYSPVRCFVLLRNWISQFGMIMPSRKYLHFIWDEMIMANNQYQPIFLLGNYHIRRYCNRIYLLPLMVPLRNIFIIWFPSTPLILPDGIGFLFSTNNGEYTLRKPLSVQTISVRFHIQWNPYIFCRTHSYSRKKFWNELKVAPWQRARIPIIYYDDKLIAALGLFITKYGTVPKGAVPWKIQWNNFIK